MKVGYCQAQVEKKFLAKIVPKRETESYTLRASIEAIESSYFEWKFYIIRNIVPEDSFGFRGNNSAFSLSEDSLFVDKAVCKKYSNSQWIK